MSAADEQQKYYAVAYGHKRGVFTKWADAQQQITGFPQAVYKKFDNPNDANKYVQDRTPTSVSLNVNKEADKFYAVARGKTVGIFETFDAAKAAMAGFPQAMHRKFEKYADALQYYEKFAHGKVPEEEKNAKNAKPKETAFYAVQRGHAPGVYATWAECQKQIEGFKGAKYKKFPTESEADEFAKGLRSPAKEQPARETTRRIARKVTNSVPSQGESSEPDESGEETASPSKRARVSDE